MVQNEIEVQPVSSGRDQREFIRFPWSHYKGDPNWVPPLIGNQKELLNFKPHPFYEDAEIQTFLARRNGKTVGRIAAIIDNGHNRTHNENRGMWGFFESIDDTSVSAALFDAVRKWHSARGISSLRGPLNPAMNHECGLLVEGFHSPPTFLMTYNHPYYEKLVLQAGFKKAQDLYSYVGRIESIQGLDPKLGQIADLAAERFGIKVRDTNKRRLASDVDEFLRVYNLALPGTWGFVPLGASEAKHMAKGLKMLLEPSLVRIAEHEGRVIGISFVMLDFNPLIREINGRLFPFGFMKLLYGRKKIRRIRMISTNVVPEFQRWGIAMVLMKSLVPTVMKWGFEEGEFSWVLESNLLSRQTLERSGANRDKTFRIYDWEPA